MRLARKSGLRRGTSLKSGHRSNVDNMDLGGKPWQFKGIVDYIFVTNA